MLTARKIEDELRWEILKIIHNKEPGESDRKMRETNRETERNKGRIVNLNGRFSKQKKKLYLDKALLKS